MLFNSALKAFDITTYLQYNYNYYFYKLIHLSHFYSLLRLYQGEGKTTYTFSVSVNAFSVEFPLACYQQAGRVWYVSRALGRTYTLFYPAPVVS